MKISIIALLTFLNTISIAQEYSKEPVDCIFNGQIIDSTNFNKFVNSLDSSTYEFNYSTKKYRRLLDCLYVFDSSNIKLCWRKAIYTDWNVRDTSQFYYYRKCIDKNFMVSDSYYNIGSGYFGHVLSAIEGDSMSHFELSENQIMEFFELAEKNSWKSFQFGLKDAVFLIGQIQKKKNEYLDKKSPIINLNDTTIQIVAYVRDCGEFGGHFETIEIKKSHATEFIATFNADSIHCEGEKTKPSENSEFNGVKAGIPKSIIIELIISLKSFDNGSIYSNGPFRIAIIYGKKNVLSQEIHGLKWEPYLDLRISVFGF